METKTVKTPLMMSEAFGLTCWPCSLVPESELSHRYQAHPCLVPKLSHHRGKTPRFALKNLFLHPSYLLHLTSYFLHLPSYIRTVVFTVFPMTVCKPLEEAEMGGGNF